MIEYVNTRYEKTMNNINIEQIKKEIMESNFPERFSQNEIVSKWYNDYVDFLKNESKIRDRSINVRKFLNDNQFSTKLMNNYLLKHLKSDKYNFHLEDKIFEQFLNHIEYI